MAKADSILGPGTDLTICLLCVTLLLASYAIDRYLETAELLSSAHETIDGLKRPEDAPSQREWAEIVDRLREALAAENAEKTRLQNELEAREGALSQREWAEIVAELREALAAETSERARLQKELETREVADAAGVELPPGHDPGKPARDVGDKNVSRVYLVNRNGSKQLYYKPYGSSRRSPVTRERLHQLLQIEQERFGAALAVEILTEGRIYVDERKCVECEFWQYDYYEFNDAYCRGMKQCPDLPVP